MHLTSENALDQQVQLVIRLNVTIISDSLRSTLNTLLRLTVGLRAIHP